MNVIIANQHGRLQGELSESGLVLVVDAQTPRRDSVHLTIPLDSAESKLYLLAVLGAVEHRINQVHLKDTDFSEQRIQDEESNEIGSNSAETNELEPDSASKSRVYGRFSNFLIRDQVEQGRLRVFFAARDEQKRIVRFDLDPGEVVAFQSLIERALFAAPRIDLLLRDELSLAVTLSACSKGMVFDVQAALWQSPFVVSKAHNIGALRVFMQRMLRGAKTSPINFETDKAGLVFRRKPDGRVQVEFRHQELKEQLMLTRLQLHEIEILARYSLYRCFEPQPEENHALAASHQMSSAEA